jgi:hypothetical protein
MPVRTGEVLRVHGIYMDRAREFEVRKGEGGRMELWDVHEGRIWVRGKDKKGKQELGNEKGSNVDAEEEREGASASTEKPVEIAETGGEKDTGPLKVGEDKVGRWGSWGRKPKEK